MEGLSFSFEPSIFIIFMILLFLYFHTFNAAGILAGPEIKCRQPCHFFILVTSTHK